MKKYEHDLLTSDNTEVLHEEDFKFNAPHLFHVITTKNENANELLASIHFQEGPTKEYGLNGVFNEDLIAMIICRLEHFQKSEFACRENTIAITKLEETLMWLRKRTLNRQKRNVQGTSIK